jgi:hypothetical protein
MKKSVFLFVYRRFRGVCTSIIRAKVIVARTYETSANYRQHGVTNKEIVIVVRKFHYAVKFTTENVYTNYQSHLLVANS